MIDRLYLVGTVLVITPDEFGGSTQGWNAMGVFKLDVGDVVIIVEDPRFGDLSQRCLTRRGLIRLHRSDLKLMRVINDR